MTKLKDLKKKSIQIELDGETYYFRFDLNALALVEEKYGDLAKAMERAKEGSILVIRHMFWAGLQASHPDLTELDVGSLIDSSNVNEIAEKMNAALDTSLSKPKKGDPKNEIAPSTGATQDSVPEK